MALLRKVKQSKALTPNEINELEEYENIMAKKGSKNQNDLQVNGIMLAKAFGKDARTIQRWVKVKGMPKLAQDQFDLAAVIAWREAQIRSEYDGKVSDESRLLKANADEREEKARIQKMKADEMAGVLIDADKAQQDILERIIAVKTALRALSITLAKRLNGIENADKAEEIIDDEVYQCLNRFAKNEELENAWQLIIDKVVNEVAIPLSRLKTVSAVKRKLIEVLEKV
ncbi:MAG: hypothetical protein JEZ07_06400 [Phycisphaerae bacterium]|nr:hypothetical protein [Phycisphaerae bacterium]